MRKNKNNKIGIMQGRVLPDSTDKLQIFPSQWNRELTLIKKLDFEYVELLDDKEGLFRKLLKKQKLELFNHLSVSKLKCNSICMDRLCNFSLISDSTAFLKELEELLYNLSDKKNFIFIIPFFDENKINNGSELYTCLENLSRYDKFLEDNNLFFSLEIDLPAGTINEVFQKFSLNSISLCYDLGNNIKHGYDLYKDIMLLKNIINHIHIKDKENGKNIQIRENNSQISGVIKALKEISFNGIMILETCINPNPLREAEKNLNTIKKYLGN